MSSRMLCRRCGMESSTTDVCEWCKRPMLPAGASITGQRAERGEAPGPTEGVSELAAEGAEGVGPLDAGPEAEEERAAAEAGPPGDDEGAEENALRPLGSSAPTPEVSQTGPAMPSHGIGEEATRTSVDLSQYTGPGDSIFRPIEHPERTGTPDGSDLLSLRYHKKETESDIPENVRLIRSLIVGVIISLVLAVLQLIVSRTMEDARSVPQSLVFATAPLIKNLGKADSVLGALLYGGLVGVMLGLGLGAVLVRFRRGPFIGMMIGLLIGYGLMNGVWGYVCGVVTGIACGIIATVGLRQVARV